MLSMVEMGWHRRGPLERISENCLAAPVSTALAPPPRATPRLGGVYVSCQYFSCSFVLALRELGLRLGVGGQSPTPAPRQLPWSPAWSPRPGDLAG
jgi:hypothetical protein